jgi:cephalosporin hydroxylase
MNPAEDFAREVRASIQKLGDARELRELTLAWLRGITPYRYPYNFAWMGRPIIQLPQDMVAIQELVWTVKPDLIIETGIAHGGSLILNASLLALLDYCDALERGEALDPRQPHRHVLGIDVDIRAHNRVAIEMHPMANRIILIEGSSVAKDVIDRVGDVAGGYGRILVCLDSNHTHDHVLSELEAYAPLTGEGSYCVVFDTLIDDMPAEMFDDRPWGRNNNPKTAVNEYLYRLKTEGRKAANGARLRFEIDTSIENKLLITVAPHGYLKRVR